MGTRHLIAVQIDGEYKIAQYGQWDGYPEGQGLTVLEFLKGTNLEYFKEKCRKASFLTQDELEALQKELDSVGEMSDIWVDNHQYLFRDAGGKILRMVNEAPEGIKLKNSLSFAGDSVFCEWAYVIDFDLNTLEVFRGFSKEPLTEDERFFNADRDNDRYYPIHHLKTYNLDELPESKDFVDTLTQLAYPDEDAE